MALGSAFSTIKTVLGENWAHNMTTDPLFIKRLVGWARVRDARRVYSEI